MKEKKTMIKFWIIMLLSMLLGFGTGMLSIKMKHCLSGVSLTQLSGGLSLAGTVFFALFNLILGGISFVLYYSCRRDYKNRREGDEELYDWLEYRLDMPMLLSNAAMILDMVLFGIVIYFCNQELMRDREGLFLLLFNVLLLFAGCAWIIVLQNKMVTFCKEMNPEKKGSVFDTKFQKVWLESCDEAQKMMIYKSDYKAFNTANMVCIVCWVISFTGMFSLGTGLLPIIMVGVIHLTLIMSYSFAARKQEKPLDRAA